jgi:hypothetical protein
MRSKFVGVASSAEVFNTPASICDTMAAWRSSFCAARDNCQNPNRTVNTTPITMANVTHANARVRGREIIVRMKYIVAIAFLAILASLGSALVFMMRNGRGGQTKSGHMVKALGLRVGVSIVLFICVLIGWHLGYIQPTGIQAGQ